MLVLSRKKDEKIIIGDKITVMVLEIRGDKVRLGIEAPSAVTVHRFEVYEAIKRENGEEKNVPPDENATGATEAKQEQLPDGQTRTEFDVALPKPESGTT